MIDPLVDLLMWCMIGGVYVWLLWRWTYMPRFVKVWGIAGLMVVVGWIIYNGIKVLELLMVEI